MSRPKAECRQRPHDVVSFLRPRRPCAAGDKLAAGELRPRDAARLLPHALQPGAVTIAHDHPGMEEVLILNGTSSTRTGPSSAQGTS